MSNQKVYGPGLNGTAAKAEKMELETINKLYLELSQITTATTARETLLQKQLAEAQRERDKAIDLLETMFSSYENGTACYEDPEDCSGFVGYAFKMDDLNFNACCDLLNRTRPRAAIDAAKEQT